MPEQIQHIPAALIIPGDNDRTSFDEIALQELAASIAENGLAQPPTVRPLPDGRYQIVAGERRYRALAHVLQRDAIPCIVRDLDDEQASAIMLAENTGRVDLNPIEEANAYRKRIDRFGWPVSRIAEAAGVNVRQINARLSLLTLNDDIQTLVANGHLPLAHAETIARLDPDRQRIALRAITSAATLPDIVMFRRLCSRLYAEQQQNAMFDLEAYTQQVQRLMAEAAKPRNGKNADTSHIPINPDLPAISCNRKDSSAVVIERWLSELDAGGHSAEAAAVGSLYTALIHARLVKLPYETGLIYT